MQREMFGLVVVLGSTTLAAAQQQHAAPVPSQQGAILQIVAFGNDGTPDLGTWGHSIASMVIAGL